MTFYSLVSCTKSTDTVGELKRSLKFTTGHIHTEQGIKRDFMFISFHFFFNSKHANLSMNKILTNYKCKSKNNAVEASDKFNKLLINVNYNISNKSSV